MALYNKKQTRDSAEPRKTRTPKHTDPEDSPEALARHRRNGRTLFVAIRLTGVLDNNDDQTMISDAITNLLHYLELPAADARGLLTRALDHYTAEPGR